MLCLAGDLNTSFLKEENMQISIAVTQQLIELVTQCKMDTVTADLPYNIDYIFLPQVMKTAYCIKPLFLRRRDC